MRSKNPQRIGAGTSRFGNKRKSRDYPDYSIIKIGQNTEKSPGDLRTLAVIQTPLANTGRKNSQRNNNNNNNSGTCW